MKYFWAILTFLLVAVGIFMIVSLSLASAHGVGLVAEWKNWFGVSKEVVPEVDKIVKSILIK